MEKKNELIGAAGEGHPSLMLRNAFTCLAVLGLATWAIYVVVFKR